ncbi:MAG: crossover junction endodeoxyribonuclease RuvC [Ruminococcaceae bacterium]|nr:crossover junction endodeoxyribonuclease RuvC [Oscillospiraceae bacterium]
MRILGIDPGYATIGYGVVDYDGFRFKTVGYGAIITPANMPFLERLDSIYNDMLSVIDKYKPEHLSIEKLYFNTNTTTAIAVAEARGVILLAAHHRKLQVFEYTPLQVKSSITGYGKAEKRQVMEMVKSFLSLKAVPKPDDTADALALAICHAHTAASGIGRIYAQEKKK